MFSLLARFTSCTRGNVAFMAAGALVPLLTLTAGGLEFAERQRVESSMQLAADTAVMAAFNSERRNWRQRKKRADHFFDTNFRYSNRVTRIKKRLRGKESRKRLVVTYQASSQVHSLFGEFNPFTNNTIKVTSRAELVYRSGRGPRLISPVSGSRTD